MLKVSSLPQHDLQTKLINIHIPVKLFILNNFYDEIKSKKKKIKSEIEFSLK